MSKQSTAFDVANFPSVLAQESAAETILCLPNREAFLKPTDVLMETTHLEMRAIRIQVVVVLRR